MAMTGFQDVCYSWTTMTKRYKGSRTSAHENRSNDKRPPQPHPPHQKKNQTLTRMNRYLSGGGSLLLKMEVSVWSSFSMARAAGAFRMRSCDVPADTFSSDSASAVKPARQGKPLGVILSVRRGDSRLICPALPKFSRIVCHLSLTSRRVSLMASMSTLRRR